jgi:hypothetical protein
MNPMKTMMAVAVFALAIGNASAWGKAPNGLYYFKEMDMTIERESYPPISVSLVYRLNRAANLVDKRGQSENAR